MLMVDQQTFDRTLNLFEGFFGAEYTDKARASLWFKVRRWTVDDFKAALVSLENKFEPKPGKKLPSTRDFNIWMKQKYNVSSEDPLDARAAQALIKQVESGSLIVSKQYLDHLGALANSPNDEWCPPPHLGEAYWSLVARAMIAFKGKVNPSYQDWARGFDSAWNSAANDDGLQKAINAAQSLLPGGLPAVVVHPTTKKVSPGIEAERKAIKTAYGGPVIEPQPNIASGMNF